MEERDWQIIKILYEEKNLTRTAHLLYMSQPALSARIKQIENKLGISLYCHDKRGSGINFTREGVCTYQFAKEVLNKITLFRQDLTSVQSAAGNIIKIAATPVIAQYYLPKLILHFQKAYPHANFEVCSYYNEQISAMMEQNDLQFGFVRQDANWHAESKILVATDTVYAVASQPFHLQQLQELPRIYYPTEASFEELINDWYMQTFQCTGRISMTVSNLDICLSMLINGLGYAFVPGMYMERLAGLYTQPIHYADGRPLNHNLWLLYQQAIAKNALARQFLQFVQDADFGSFKNLYDATRSLA